MLIVNADDWGLRREVTDAIAACWQAGAITSASAMVGMADSERAFGLAAGNGLPLGLHLNLTAPLDGEGVSPAARRRQAELVAYFVRGRGRRYGFDPRIRGAVDLAVADQLLAYARASGALPARADGHQHIQTCPTVLACRSLGAVRILREAHGYTAAGFRLKATYRAAVNRCLRARFRSVPFVSLRDLHPALGGSGLDRLRALAGRGPLELMVHPAWEDEREVLLSAEWRRLLAELPTGTHQDLL